MRSHAPLLLVGLIGLLRCAREPAHPSPPQPAEPALDNGSRELSPQYLGTIVEWSRARLLPRGHCLGPRPEGSRPCVAVLISIAETGRVTAVSTSGTGHAEFDRKVQADATALQGAYVPLDPEGGPPPPTLRVKVCWD